MAAEGAMTFDLDRFVSDCQIALAEDRSHNLIREVVARAVSEPSSVLKALGAPKRGGVQTLYRSEHLTILKISYKN